MDEAAELDVSWARYHALIEQLALQVHQSGWPCDAIIGVARGGLRVADVLARVLQRPMGVIFTSAYRAEGGTVAGPLQIAEQLSSARPLPGPNWLVVDDLVDRGGTLQALCAVLPQRYPQVKVCRTAVLWAKAGASLTPDFCVERLAGRPWIRQPFERYEVQGVAGLLADPLGNKPDQA